MGRIPAPGGFPRALALFRHPKGAAEIHVNMFMPEGIIFLLLRYDDWVFVYL
jgi:hypothetical protein